MFIYICVRVCTCVYMCRYICVSAIASVAQTVETYDEEEESIRFVSLDLHE